MHAAVHVLREVPSVMMTRCCCCVYQVMLDFYNETYTERNGQEPSESTLDLLWATTVSIFAVGGMFGGLLGGWWADYFGRCVVMLTSCLEVCDFETYLMPLALLDGH